MLLESRNVAKSIATEVCSYKMRPLIEGNRTLDRQLARHTDGTIQSDRNTGVIPQGALALAVRLLALRFRGLFGPIECTELFPQM